MLDKIDSTFLLVILQIANTSQISKLDSVRREYEKRGAGGAVERKGGREGVQAGKTQLGVRFKLDVGGWGSLAGWRATAV